jgi:Caspase domain
VRRVVLAAALGLALLALGRRADASPIRILVAAGHARGQDGEKPLKHTQDDVARVRDVFVARGAFDAVIALTDPSAAELWEGMRRAEAIARAHPVDDVTVFFYFSGHGDAQSLHLGVELVPLGDVAAALGKIPARLRIAVTDACRTSDALQKKGGAVEPGFAVEVEEMKSAAGAVWLHASSDGEAAQESEELGGAVFTHYWVTGLGGAADANGDGRVTLEESFAYAYDQTVFRTARSARILQRPSVSLDLRESAPLVLTRTAANSARLVLPREASVSYVVYGVGSRAVLLEAWGQADRGISLALPRGRYIVQRRGTGRYGAAEIALGEGERRALGDADFRAIAEESLAAKGGTLLLRPHELGAGYAAVVGHFTALGHGPWLSYAYRTGDWALGGHLAVAFSSRDADLAHEATRRWEAGASIDYALVPWLRLGGGPLLSLYDRRFLLANGDLLQAGGYAATQTQTTFVFGGEVHALVRVALGARAWLGLRVQATANVASLDGVTQVLGYAQAGPTLGLDL